MPLNKKKKTTKQTNFLRNELHNGAAYLTDNTQLILVFCAAEEKKTSKKKKKTTKNKKTKCIRKIDNLKWLLYTNRILYIFEEKKLGIQ